MITVLPSVVGPASVQAQQALMTLLAADDLLPPHPVRQQQIEQLLRLDTLTSEDVLSVGFSVLKQSAQCGAQHSVVSIRLQKLLGEIAQAPLYPLTA